MQHARLQPGQKRLGLGEHEVDLRERADHPWPAKRHQLRRLHLPRARHRLQPHRPLHHACRPRDQASTRPISPRQASRLPQVFDTPNTEPLHLVLDEADLWAPQRVQQDGFGLLGRVEEIVRRGRVRGFVPWLITQRPAVLHKDVLSQADVLVSMKLTASQDWAAVGRWIEGQADRAEGRRILAALPQLRRGEGWVWAPGDGVLAKIAFPRIRTLDGSRAPRRAEVDTPPRTLAALDVAAARDALAGMGVDAPDR